MSTTDILFNSPALHSLKRTQLVQLCKRHNVKATGKNADIIERLKQHAQDLPANVMETDNDDLQENEDETDGPQRLSEIWEVVMEGIPEESGSLRSAHSSMKGIQSKGSQEEFGMSTSKPSSMSSSIKALATSLGLKRSVTSTSTGYVTAVTPSASNPVPSYGTDTPKKATTTNAPAFHNTSTNTPARDSLTAHAVPYSSLPPTPASSLPQTDPFNFDAANTSTYSDRPIPGLGGREGVECIGTSPGTIRLITSPFVPAAPSPPPLHPFEPAFELVPPTPGKTPMSRWPMSPRSSMLEADAIYPSLDMGTSDGRDTDVVMGMPGGTSALHVLLPPQNPKTPARKTSGPFVFGSPDPRYSITNTAFKSAASNVLAEMNARLGLSGETAVGIDIIAGRKHGQAAKDADQLLNHRFGGAGAGIEEKVDPGKRFEKAHEDEFRKMGSIKDHYAAKRPIGSDEDGKVRPKKRKSSALGAGLPSAAATNERKRSSTRVISTGSRKQMALPGGFGDDEDDEERPDDGRRLSKRPRMSEMPREAEMEAVEGRRVSIAPPPMRETPHEDGEDTQRGREAIKRKLEYNKAKRRSSMGRVSVGGGKAPLIPNQKTPRFGFLSSAKSLVKKVWNRGAAGGASKAAPLPAVPDQKQRQGLFRSRSPSKNYGDVSKEREATKPSVALGRGALRNANDDSNRLLKAAAPKMSIASTSSSSRERSPFPLISGSGDTIRSTTTSTGGSGSRAESSLGIANKSSSNVKGKVSVSSLGMRNSAASNSDTVSSLGARNSLASVAATGSAVGSIAARKRTTSTLLAPTASSLAKMQSPARPAAATSAATTDGAPKLTKSALEQITNKKINKSAPKPSLPSKIPVSMISPRPGPGKIFSSPFVLPADANAAEKASPGSAVNPITGLVSPSRSKQASNAMMSGSKAAALKDKAKGQPKIPVPVQRKPRISRSKVIAKLGAQRAATASGSMGMRTPGTPRSKMRSSVGTAARRSFGGAKASSGAGGSRGSGLGPSLMLSAKKRARQSEYTRRRSAKTQSSVGAAAMAMEIDT